MFGFFKPKKSTPTLADIIRLDDTAFVLAVKQMLEKGPPGAWAMCVVAYQNLEPMLAVSFKLSKEQPSGDAPANLDAFIQLLSSRLAEISEEIPRRRLAWFFQAALIRRATELASQNTNLQHDVAAIRIMLARGSAYFSNILPKNILWSEDEKAYFV